MLNAAWTRGYVLGWPPATALVYASMKSDCCIHHNLFFISPFLPILLCFSMGYSDIVTRPMIKPNQPSQERQQALADYLSEFEVCNALWYFVTHWSVWSCCLSCRKRVYF